MPILFVGVRLQAVDADLHLGFQLGPNVHQKRIDRGINDVYRKTWLWPSSGTHGANRYICHEPWEAILGFNGVLY
jgi:hypothetical protein